MAGVCYICAVPIGNLNDITLRALEVLKNADYTACEDTRVTRMLLDKHGINGRLIQCHKFNEKAAAEKIIPLLLDGADIVLVTDAGTPLISDPGGRLIEELEKHNIKITPVPGACAVTAFLSALPRYSEEFAFIGFIPRTAERQIQVLNKYKNINCVFYESPLRLLKTLENIASEYGAETKISIGRELTKMYEEIKTGAVSDIIEYYKTHPLKGEITAMLYAQTDKLTSSDILKDKILLLKKEGFSAKDISKIISLLYNTSRNFVYKTALELFD